MSRLPCLVSLCLLVACGVEAPGSSDPAGVAETEARIARITSAVLATPVIRGEPARYLPLAERMAELGVPGASVAVFEDGDIVWARGWGLADVGSGRAVTPETLFQAASIAKPVAALAALRLVENGAIGLDDDVNARLTSWRVPDNEFTSARKVTLRTLLNHSAGTTVSGFPGYGPGEPLPSTVGVLDGAGNTDPVRVFNAPGERWRYSGGGYTVMQLLLEDVSGQPFAELMRRSVLEPLGMSRSTYEQPLPADRHAAAATGYEPRGSAVDGRWHVYPEQAAAGLWTTPTDLARYAIAIQRAYAGAPDAVLGASLAQEMLTPGMNDHGLGPGLSAGGTIFGHGGANRGFVGEFMAFVDGRGGVAVMTNSDLGGRLAREIILTVATEYGWPGLERDERTVVALTPEAATRLAGTYGTATDPAAMEVRHEDGQLWLVLPGGQPRRLFAESATEFFLRDGAPVRFAFDGNEVELVALGRRGRK